MQKSFILSLLALRVTGNIYQLAQTIVMSIRALLSTFIGPVLMYCHFLLTCNTGNENTSILPLQSVPLSMCAV